MQRNPRFSRRAFLRTVATGSAALALEPLLAACSKAETFSTAVQSSPGQPLSPATQSSSAILPSATNTTEVQPLIQQPGVAGPTTTSQSSSNATTGATPETSKVDLGEPALVVVHGDIGRESEQALEMVLRLLAPLGGIERFVAQGASVVIKPNICTGYYSYEYAATTNPFIVGALVTLCVGAGAKRVKVMDFPFGGSAQSAYKTSGIQAQVQAAGGEMVVMSPMKYLETEIPRGVDLKQWTVYEDVLNTDVLINVPILKHHSLARLTLGMKNLMGVTNDRSTMHRNLGQRIADLTSRVMPQLTVIDAMRALMANGPTGGSLNDVKTMGTLIASADIIAADSYAARLVGVQPDELEYLSAGSAMGLGRSDLDNLRIEEINL